MKRNWQWLAGLLAAGLICTTYFLAKTQTMSIGVDTQATSTAAVIVAPPNDQETADSMRLIQAVNTGDTQTALGILHAYGVADDTLLAMATRLGIPPTRVGLKETFLKASFAGLTLADPVLKTNVLASLSNAITALGYEQPVWMPSRPDIRAIRSYDLDLAQCPVAPIAVLNVRLNDPCFIRYFKWYDRYAESLHSVVLNGPNLSNAKLDATDYDQANRTLNALFRLVKARKTDAFAWLGVVNEADRSDEQWLKAMTFMPDGLQISNLRQFHSPFAETRNRYVGIVGSDMPMMVVGFYGETAALQERGKMLAAALTNNDPQAVATVMAQLGGIGSVVGPHLAQVETNLQSLGYRGVSTHWLLLAAIVNSNNAVAINQSDLLNPRAGLLDIYYGQKDYVSISSLTAEMITNSAPGDMNWTVGKLYRGIALLSQTPPRTSQAITVLDQILAFDFTNKPGRGHYILGAVKWRIYAAFLSGDTVKPTQLVQWVQNQEFRNDLKSEFLKQYAGLLPPPTATPQ